MITLMTGTQVVIDVEGKSHRLLGSIDSVEQDTIAVRLDDGQPVMRLVPMSSADLLVDADGGLMRLHTQIYDTQSNGKRIRLVKPSGITGRDRRGQERIAINNALLWSQLTDDGLLTAQRHGLTRDISLSGMAFETLNSPPELGSIVAISGVDPYQKSAVLATVVGVDDAPSQRLRHVVRCALTLANEQTKANLTDLIESAKKGPRVTRAERQSNDRGKALAQLRLGR